MRNCKHCGIEFKPKGPQIYCNAECRELAQAERRREERAARRERSKPTPYHLMRRREPAPPRDHFRGRGITIDRMGPNAWCFVDPDPLFNRRPDKIDDYRHHGIIVEPLDLIVWQSPLGTHYGLAVGYDEATDFEISTALNIEWWHEEGIVPEVPIVPMDMAPVLEAFRNRPKIEIKKKRRIFS